MIAKDSLNMSKQNCQNNSGYMNCAIYTGVSTDNQAEVEFNSCQTQEQKIKKLRRQHKLSQENLAQKAGITYSTLIKLESGANKNPTISTLKKIAATFRVSLDRLIG